MRRIIIITGALLLCCAMVFAATSGGKTQFTGNFKFGGSTTVDPIVRASIEAFAKIQPKAKISYDAQGSGVGITGVIDGVYLLGGSSRDLSQAEKDKGAVENVIALDGLAVIVNGAIPLADLPRKQIADIFNGTIKNWKEVGGPDAAIVVVNRDEASGSRVAFLELVLQKEYKKTDAAANFIKDAITVNSNGDMVTKVGTTPNAVGYCGEGFLTQARSAGAKPVSVNGISVSAKTVLDKTYPISRQLYMVSKGAMKAGTLEKAFLDFLLSAQGQGIVKQEGFIPLQK